MSRFSLLLVLFAGLFAAAAFAGPATFADENPIRQVVSDCLHELENGILQVVGQTPHALSFARFASRHRKRYESVEEIKQRFQIFLENLKMIRSHNKKGLSYKLGVNEYTDLTWEEFRRDKLGAAQNCSATTKGNLKLTNDVLPETAAYAQAFGKGISLSEQQLVDCAGAFNNFGCNGGLPSQAFEYIKFNGGLDTEEAYPYTGKNGGAEDELKYAVALVRPVSIAFEVIKGFKQYKSGVYTSTECGNTPMDVNHAVLAVGYGVENGVPYWLIKNSWGADWGDNGYFKMEMGKNMCGISTCASYPVVA
ncbi:hypothetical protein RND71_042473 [Anisodus tanguticus]|uniref:Uncharacterized protein n=1 Tax=Anisodus tanguticus TaxID=243964 RepID=A0AAE1QQR2_9SOLA|nr:hypothetical protein RND71_042473 [Anisodus tanguticus]